jgi:hypothetical protein
MKEIGHLGSGKSENIADLIEFADNCLHDYFILAFSGPRRVRTI